MNDKTQKIAAELAPKIRQAIANGVTDKFVEQEIQSAIEKATDFYKRRCDALQQAQKEMRDPERQIVCDILANGFRDKAIEKSRAAHASEQGAKRHELLERIQDYLAKGGLFNPELMEADKVQRLIMDCRTYIVQHERAAHAREPFDYKGNAEVCDAIREMLKGFASIGGINPVDAYNLALAGAEVQREYSRAAHASEP